jgi:hypothetical protein
VPTEDDSSVALAQLRPNISPYSTVLVELWNPEIFRSREEPGLNVVREPDVDLPALYRGAGRGSGGRYPR